MRYVAIRPTGDLEIAYCYDFLILARFSIDTILRVPHREIITLTLYSLRPNSNANMPR
jgi:hypothetical protein